MSTEIAVVVAGCVAALPTYDSAIKDRPTGGRRQAGRMRHGQYKVGRLEGGDMSQHARAVKRPRGQILRAVALVIGAGVVGCDGSSTPATPTPQPGPTPQPAPVQLAVFSDPDSSFMTSDVRDVQGQIVRFDMANGSLIWVADGRSFSGYPVNGLFIRADRFFQVRFGTEVGERRAYFTEAVATTICDVEVAGGQLVITPTNVHVPGT
jgi:hypothetical protein